MATFEADFKDFDGLQPAIDPRRAAKPFVMGGENFIFDVDGPKSWFGSEFISYKKFSSPEAIYTFRVEDEIFIFTVEGVFSFDTAFNDYYPLYIVEYTEDIWPWSSARCGDSYYFCRKGVGVVRYQYATKKWSLMTTEWLPDDPRWVTQSQGRLVVLGSDRYVWSALDDGTDLEPSLTTGAGFQQTSLIGGTPYRVDQVLDGFVCFTSRGIIKARYVSSAAVFYHTVHSKAVKLFSPFAAVAIDDFTVIALTFTGLYSVTAEAPAAWQPVMSEYLKNTILPGLDVTLLNVLRLDYAIDAQIFLLSIGSNSAPNNYFTTYALYIPVGKWGVLNKQHQGFGELYISDGANKGVNFGFICPGGYLHRVGDFSYTELGCTLDYQLDLYWRSEYDYPTRDEDGTWIVSSSMRTWWADPISWKGFNTGRYELNGIFYESSSDIDIEELVYMESTTYIASSVLKTNSVLVRWIAELYQQNLAGLSSSCTVGLLRFTEQVDATVTSMLEDFVIGTQPASTNVEHDDWLENYQSEYFEDWLSVTPTVYEDWGFGVAAQAFYETTLMQSDDGINLIDVGEEVPTLFIDLGSERVYKPAGWSSVYHKLKFSASEIGEIFQLKLLRLTGMITGVLKG